MSDEQEQVVDESGLAELRAKIRRKPEAVDPLEDSSGLDELLAERSRRGAGRASHVGGQPMSLDGMTPYARAAFNAEIATLATTPKRKRNDALNVAAFNLGQLVGAGLLDEQVVVEALTMTALRIGLTESETRRSTASGLTAGKADPRQVPAPRGQAGRSSAAATGEPTAGDEVEHRRLLLTPADSIGVRPVRWLWHDRLAIGTLALLGGREGIGKSTVAFTIAASISRGRLRGVYLGEPRAVVIASTEDSWSHTIVPRLIAADADLSRVYRVDVATSIGTSTTMSLPHDLAAARDLVTDVDAALLLLDPVISRLDSRLDTHKDADVRRALEPLGDLAEQTGLVVLGVIHVNKSSSSDPLNLLMGSRAFGAVARSVLFVMRAPDDDGLRLLGEPKNNLGRHDLPTLTFSIETAHVADTDEGPVLTGRLVWNGEREQSISDALSAASEDAETRSATDEAAEWLVDHLTSQGGSDESADIKTAGRKAGHNPDALKRARRRLRAVSTSVGFPRRTVWTLPGTAGVQSEHARGGSAPTAPTAPTGETSEVLTHSLSSPDDVQSVQSVQWEQTPREALPLDVGRTDASSQGGLT